MMNYIVENMSKKHSVEICKCGRIHMIDDNKLNKVLRNNKNLLIVCGGCGKATLIGADVHPDRNDPDNRDKDSYMMYSFDFSPNGDKSVMASDFESTENHKGIEEILYSHGIEVPMLSGRYATDYESGVGFSDRWYPDFWKIQRSNITVEEIMDFIDEYTHDRTTVSMDRFICETPEDILEELSYYRIEGFNWKGTKWETEWNSR